MYKLTDSAGRNIFIKAVAENIFRIIYTGKEQVINDSLIMDYDREQEVPVEIEDKEDVVCLSTNRVAVHIQKESGACRWEEKESGKILLQEGEKSLVEKDVFVSQIDGDAPIIHRVKTVDGERNFIQNLKQEVDRKAYRGKLGFCFAEKERIFGLGQGEEGIYNYRGHSQYLYQHNMRIPMPCFLSTNGYGILADCCSLMTFEDNENESYFFFDTIDQMDYYFVAGENLDEIIQGFRTLTGAAQMLPRWAFGYIQSKETYVNQQELVDTVAEYRRRNVPIDGIVQDWRTWEADNWGEKVLDKKRYPNMLEAAGKIHEMHAHTMVSIWPNMNQGGQNYEEMLAAGHMLTDLSTYDAFQEEARAIYFQQAKRGLFDEGFDSWWCDSTEPFSGPDWNGEEKREPWERYLLVGEEHKKYIDEAKVNAYALMHAKGMYENQRKVTDKKRVLNLTRSGYPSIQKYGAVLWSGDTCATWKNFAIQIREGLNMAMSGYPYWTLDIGAFFTIHKKWENRGCCCNQDSTMKWFWKGDYEDGVNDLGYRELYTRWLQFGTFLPMFRAHGTDTPREIWQFGEPGEMFYDAIEASIKLRYMLMPYIYSIAAKVHFEGYTMLRSLLFDFAEDETVGDIWDAFMFGPSMLICPVTNPMYYDSKSRKIDKEKTRSCYLPKGCGWYDFWTHEFYEGGSWVTAKATIDRIPIFIKAGAVIPVSAGIQYADQLFLEPNANGICMEIQVYKGKKGTFTLYEDAGDGYGFEQGEYATTEFIWDEEAQNMTIGEQKGSYPGIRKSPEYKIHII